MRRPGWLAPATLGIVFIAIWFFAAQTGSVPSFLLPHPVSVVDRLVGGLQEGYLLASLLQTLKEAIIGCLIAAAIGVPLGCAIALISIMSSAIEPYLAASQAIPAVAIAPLLVTWVGYGTAPIVILCAVMVIFPVIIGTAVGIRSIDPEIISAARLDGAGSWTLLRRIELPLAGPNIMAGLRTGFTLAITGAVVGEMVVGGQRGLGIELVTSQHLNDTAGLFATILLLAFVAVAIYLISKALEDRVVRAVAAN